MIMRTIARIINSNWEQVAPGFEIRRPLPSPGLRQVDPFLLLDHFGPLNIKAGKEPGVPDHPHRGFEPVSIILKGMAEHRDSMGNHGLVRSGGVQWMTAGSGVVHSEYMHADDETGEDILHGIQLWVNLPAELKMTKPAYQNITADKIPVVEEPENHARIRVISGEYHGTKGPAKTHTPVLIFHLELGEDGKASIPIPGSFNACYYVLEGSAGSDQPAAEGSLVLFQQEGDAVEIFSKKGANILLLAGEPLNEPLASYGPFVMNTQQELVEAVRDYQEGKMGSIDH